MTSSHACFPDKKTEGKVCDQGRWHREVSELLLLTRALLHTMAPRGSFQGRDAAAGEGLEDSKACIPL